MYNTIDIGKIRFDNKPYKKIKSISVMGDDNMIQTIVKSIYYIDIDYLGKSLYVQIPCFRLHTINDDVLELIINQDFYSKFIKTLESYIIDIVHAKSEQWFLGKRFTMNKIINCIVSNVANIGSDYYLSLVLSKTVMLYDNYKNEISLEKLKEMLNNNVKPIDIVCIIKIDNLQFIDNRFICNLVIEQAKIIKETRITEYSIIDEQSEDTNVDYVSGSSCILEDEYYKEK